MKGYIKLFRKFLDWEWYTSPVTKELFIHLLLKANWRDKEWRGITIKRGQLVTSRRKLAAELEASEQSIKTAIANLQKSQDITVQSKPNYTIITVNNYDTYQVNSPTEVPKLNKPKISKHTPIKTGNVYQDAPTPVETKQPTPELSALFERIFPGGNQLITWINESGYPEEWIRKALIITDEKQEKKSVSYCRGILERYQKQGGPQDVIKSNSRYNITQRGKNTRGSDSGKSKFANHPAGSKQQST